MSNDLWEAKFVIADLFMPDLELQEDKIWLGEKEVLIRPYKNGVIAYVKVKDHNEYEAENKILSYLRLCSLLTTYTPKIEGGTFHLLDSDSDFGEDTTILSVGEVVKKYTEEQKSKMMPHFTDFLKKSYAVHKKYSQLFSVCPFLEIANEYFYRSKANSEHKSESFVDAAISLEALFNEEPSDVRYKIAMRASYVLGCIGYDASEVFQNVTNLYKTRNSIVHGGGGKLGFGNIIQIWLYARQCIKCMFVLCLNRNSKLKELGKEKRKGFVLKQIDEAMLDKVKWKHIQREIKEGIKDFNLGIPRQFRGKNWKIGW